MNRASGKNNFLPCCWGMAPVYCRNGDLYLAPGLIRLLSSKAITLWFFSLLPALWAPCLLAVPVNELGPIDKQVYAGSPPAPAQQTKVQADAKSEGCLSCHTKTDTPTMHVNQGVTLGCTDCHGGDAAAVLPESTVKGSAEYSAVLDKAHVHPLYPQAWRYPSSATPERTYSLLNLESPEFIRFANPGDYRVTKESCGACHLKEVLAAERSIMATGAMLWGGAAYNNGILPFKQYVAGEYYVTKKGEEAELAQGGLTSTGAILKSNEEPDDNMKAKGVLPLMAPLPAWESLPPGDVFRVFERGGRLLSNLFPQGLILTKLINQFTTFCY